MIDWTKKPKTVLLTGNSEFLKEREIDGAVKALPGYSLLEFDASSDMEGVELTLTSRSLFAEKKLVVIRSIGEAKSRRKILTEYCANPQDDITLILSSRHQKRLLKWVTTSLKVEEKQKLDEMPSWELSDWVVDEGRARGLSVSKSFAEAIVLNVGTDLYSLTNELDKLSVYCEDRTNVEVADIEAVLFQHTSFSPFEVVDLWASGEMSGSSRMFLAHLDNTPSTEWMKSVLVIMGSLQDRVEHLLRARDMKSRGKSSNDIAKSLGVSTYIYLNRLTPQLTARKSVALEDAYIELADIESKIKMGGPGKLLLESFLLRH